jgi:hypothetical protein
MTSFTGFCNGPLPAAVLLIIDDEAHHWLDRLPPHQSHCMLVVAATSIALHASLYKLCTTLTMLRPLLYSHLHPVGVEVQSSAGCLCTAPLQLPLGTTLCVPSERMHATP